MHIKQFIEVVKLTKFNIILIVISNMIVLHFDIYSLK